MEIMFSKITSRNQTVIPRAVRDKLGLKPGDRLAYALTDKGIVIKKAKAGLEDDPFSVFSEWSSPEDDEAYAGL